MGGRIDTRRLLVQINGINVGPAGDLLSAPPQLIDGILQQRFVVTVPALAFPRSGARVIVFDAERVTAVATFLCDHAELHAGPEPFIRIAGCASFLMPPRREASP
jgi:hypothetical protein